MASGLSSNPNAGDIISQVAHAEGGTTKGSASAQLQSQVAKERNAQRAEEEVAQKLKTNPGSVSIDDAAYVQSREARASGGVSELTSAAHKTAYANELARAEQSAFDRTANYAEAAHRVGSKMATDQSSVTKEDANLLHSRETRAFGATEKGGLTSQAQRLAAENAGETKE